MRVCIALAMQTCIIARMNPSEAIQHLKQAGMTEKAIGAAVGANQSTINRIANGARSFWDIGQKLVELAQRTPLPDASAGDQAEAA